MTARDDLVAALARLEDAAHRIAELQDDVAAAIRRTRNAVDRLDLTDEDPAADLDLADGARPLIEP